jgi:hypothetical protein
MHRVSIIAQKLFGIDIIILVYLSPKGEKGDDFN